MDDEPTSACPVGNTCNHPSPSERSTVTFTMTAVAATGTTPPVIWTVRTTPADNFAPVVPTPARLSTSLVGVTGTNRDAPAGADICAVASEGDTGAPSARELAPPLDPANPNSATAATPDTANNEPR